MQQQHKGEPPRRTSVQNSSGIGQNSPRWKIPKTSLHSGNNPGEQRAEGETLQAPQDVAAQRRRRNRTGMIVVAVGHRV